MGIFNFKYGVAATTTSPRVVTTRVRILDIRDGTSNTAMFSETKRSMASNSNGGPRNNYDPTMVYLLPSTDDGWSPLTPIPL